MPASSATSPTRDAWNPLCAKTLTAASRIWRRRSAWRSARTAINPTLEQCGAGRGTRLRPAPLPCHPPGGTETFVVSLLLEDPHVVEGDRSPGRQIRRREAGQDDANLRDQGRDPHRLLQYPEPVGLKRRGQDLDGVEHLSG